MCLIYTKVEPLSHFRSGTPHYYNMRVHYTSVVVSILSVILSGKVHVVPVDEALVYINGKAVSERTEIRTGSRVILGRNYVFRFNHPEQAAKERLEGMAKSQSSDIMSKCLHLHK